MCVFEHLHESMYTCVGDLRVQLCHYTLKPELQAVVSHPVWVLGSRLMHLSLRIAKN